MAKDVIEEKAEVTELEGYSGRKRLATGKPYFTGNFGVGPLDHVDSQDAAKSKPARSSK